MPNEDASKIEKHMFRVYDSNDDGYIDAVEFMVGLSSFHPHDNIWLQLIYHIMADGSPQEVLAKIFRVFDQNRFGIGQLPRVSGKDPERKEWTSVFETLVGQLPRVSGEDP